VYGDQRAVIVEVGGGVRTYSVGGREVIDGYAADEVAEGAKGQTLIPWPNRLGGGRYSFGGKNYQVPLSEPAQGNALHGFVRWASFTVAERDAASVALTHRLHAREHYPFTLDIRHEYSLSDVGLTCATTAINAGTTALPYAIGFHPYLTAGTPLINEALLHLPAASYITTDGRQLPTGTAPVDGTPYDFRSPKPLGATKIDYAFAGLDRDVDGRAWLRLRNPHDGWTVAFWIDEGFRYLELFTGDGLRRAREGLGVEPMSCPPNGLQSGTELYVIEPGDTVITRWGVGAG